jgi:hypothetical protein
LSALVVTLAYVMSLNNVVIRPQNWSWLPFMVTLILLRRYADRQLQAKWLWSLPVLMVFWVNVHGAFVLEIVLIGAFCVGEALAAVLKLPAALPWPKIKVLMWVGLCTGLAILVNPLGFGIFGYVMNLMGDQPSQTLIMEWQSPTPEGIANTVFFVSIIFLMMAVWYTSYRPRPTQVLLLLGFLWLAWSGVRYVIWFALSAMPLFAEALKAIVKQRRWLVSSQKNLLNLCLGVLIFVPVLFVQPWFPGLDVSSLPEAYRGLVWQETDVGAFLSVRTPIGASEYLNAHPGGNLFNEMGYGSYFIWANPEQQIFIDPRVELYPYEQWEDYVKITHGVHYQTLFEKYGIDRVVLDIALQEDLMLSLMEDSAWQQVYADDYAQVWALCPGSFCE